MDPHRAAGSGVTGTLPGPDYDDLAEVHLLQVPVQVWARSQEHVDELLREFSLIAADPAAAGAVPARLTSLVRQVTEMYSGVGSEQESLLFAAAEAGQAALDLDFSVPVAVTEACVLLDRLLDEADEFCRAGRHLLTLTTPPDLVRFRRWYLGEFVAQVGGAAPVPWPDYPAA